VAEPAARHAIRARLTAAVLAAATVAAGLAARTYLTGPAGKYLGVALWAMLVYCLIPFARPRTAVPAAAFASLAIGWTVEFAQLTPLPAWLSSQHTILRLIFGTTFHAPDLAALAAGVLAAAAVHGAFLRIPAGSAARLKP
jgi:uncharacterized protein DUF2809